MKDQTIEARLHAGETALHNALADVALQEGLTAFGYDTDTLTAGKVLVDQARAFYEAQLAEYGDQRSATEAVNTARAEAHTIYMVHLRLARIALKQETGAVAKLGLGGNRKASLSGWLAQARQFYTNLLAEPNYLVLLASLGQTEESLQAGAEAVEAVAAANAFQEREKGVAQKATADRDAALDAMDDWLADFREVARIAFTNDPQQLEKLGMG